MFDLIEIVFSCIMLALTVIRLFIAHSIAFTP
jgi:hypothetical protein